MKNGSMADRVFSDIKQDIFSGRYSPGDKYSSENELCNRFSVSRTTVREALRMLQALGIIDLMPGRGAFVAICKEEDLHVSAVDGIFSNESDLLELTELRMAIEPLAAKYAAMRASEEEIFTLLGISAFFEQAYRDNNIEKMIDTDEKFHLHLISCSHSKALIKVYAQLSQVTKRCRAMLFAIEGNGGAAVSEHKAIAEAIASRDLERSKSAAEQHISCVYENIKSIAKRKDLS
jgi:GntR family transcriptional repressor for pyruvate dehydrogenase complex